MTLHKKAFDYELCRHRATDGWRTISLRWTKRNIAESGLLLILTI